MQEMKQGDEYDEFGFDEDAEEESDEGAEETSGPITSIYGIPIKYLIIGGVVLLILVMVLVGINFTSSGDRYEEPTYVDQQVYQEPSFVEEQPVITEPVQEAAPDVQPSLDNLGDGEYALLRKYGYSADEIELALKWGYSVQDMIEASMALQDEAAKEALQRMSDTAGSEYKTLMNYTYLGQPEITVDDQRGLDADTLVSEVVTETINADYIKCPTKGVQLFLKCRIGDNTYFWYAVTPQRWVTLPDSGNIVLDLTVAYYGDDVFIIDAVEANDALDTINSSDVEGTGNE